MIEMTYCHDIRKATDAGRMGDEPPLHRKSLDEPINQNSPGLNLGQIF